MAMVRITSVNGTYNRRFDLHTVRKPIHKSSRCEIRLTIALWNQTYNEKKNKDSLKIHLLLYKIVHQQENNMLNPKRNVTK